MSSEGVDRRDEASAVTSPGEPGGSALPAGTRLSEFELKRVLGVGGFGIVYLAFDQQLHRHVAIKEYLPAAYAVRHGTQAITALSTQHQETFEAGLRSFIQEARLLARFEHPALVKVLRFWEANGTAYMAMPHYQGRTLRDILKDGATFGEAELRALIWPLLEALEHLHAEQCFHRDISPENIIVQPSGAPVLLDFGAARRIIGNMTQALTVVLKQNYAPIEQYSDDGGLAQGPWTDVYGVAAVMYTAIARTPPPSAVARVYQDPLKPLASLAPPGFRAHFLRGIDAGLAVRPEDRPRSVAAFREALGPAADDDMDRTVNLPKEGVRREPAIPMGKLATGAGAALRAQPGAVAAEIPIVVTSDNRHLPPPPMPRAHRNRLALFAVSALALVAAGAYLLLSPDRTRAPAVTASGTSTDAPLVATAPASPGPTTIARDAGSAAPPASPAPEPVNDPGAVPAGTVGPATPDAPAPAPAPEPAVVARAAPAEPVATARNPAALAVDATAAQKSAKAREQDKDRERAKEKEKEKPKEISPRAAAGATEARAPATTAPPATTAMARPAAPADSGGEAPRGAAAADADKGPDGGGDAYRDLSEEARRLRVAADRGESGAQVALGKLYAAGKGAPRSDVEAARWFRKAADQGSAEAGYFLGVLYAAGRGVGKDPAEAARWYRKSAEQGNVSAQNNLGAMYADGAGVPKDEAEAAKWYRRAAEQGHASAQVNLGAMYAFGQGVPKDEAEAVAWYRKAAEQGNARAQNNLAVMYTNGQGVARDEAEAARWYRRAAEQGSASAQYNLAVVYASGRGVMKDEAEAINWYRKAAAQGYAPAVERLKSLEGGGTK